MSDTVQHNLPQLMATLRTYQQVSKKSWGDVLANEAKWFAMGLWQEFKRISPKPADIERAAEARNFRMGRKGNFISKSAQGIALAAWRGMKELMGNRESDYFKVMDVGDTLTVRRVRFSARGKHRLLTGGRRGNKFSKSALHASEAPDALAEELTKRTDIHLLNRRALAVAIELRLRQMAAKGGTMALQWLHQVYKKRSNAMVKSGGLVSRSAKGIPLGQVTFAVGSDGEPKQITLSGFVPGTAQQAQEHNIVETVEKLRVADRMAYIQRKADETARKAGFK